jgi:membrane protease YdiL (CAAX protease family)
VAPIFEELLFRGFAYPDLKDRVGTVGALLLVSALFALMHAHVASAAPLFALGLALVFAYEYTGSIVAPMALHALFNATNVATLLYVRAHS